MTNYVDKLVSMSADQYGKLAAFAEQCQAYGTAITAKELSTKCANGTPKLEIPFLFLREDFKINGNQYFVPEKIDFEAATRVRNGEPENEPEPELEIVDEEEDEVQETIVPEKVISAEESKLREEEARALIPRRNSLYVPHGNHPVLFNILKSGLFAPVYITGLSGNGKTFMVEQIAAKLKRPVIRVNFTIETDEDDLIGGFRLADGKTFFEKGPVVRAMEIGAILLLDEIDLASPARIMCLQSITEGTGYFIKKTGEYIRPHKDFMIVATANTKGRGDDTAKFIATNVHNEAALERFSVVLEQTYPNSKLEQKMLEKVFESYEMEDDDFINTLIKWAEQIRKNYHEQTIDEVISTRRLVHIAKMYAIFGDRHRAVELCLNRFDDYTKRSFMELFKKLLPIAEDHHASRKANFRTYSSGANASA